MNLSPLPIQKFFDNNGNPLNGGLLFTYVAGTATKIATYTDSTGGATNTNPIVLDYRGEANVWLDPTLTYKFTLAPVGDTDPPTKPIWTVDNIASSITLASLTQQIIGQILFPRTAAEIAAAVTPTNYAIPSNDTIGFESIIRLGADPLGVADSRTAINNASSVGRPILIPAGTYMVNSNVTIAPNIVFEPAAMLKPAAGVTITLSSTFQAGIYQIFDLSLGGYVQLPLGTSEVWAEWWGAKGDNIKTNNEVPFNQAWYALAQLISNISYGGLIRFSRGLFLHSGTMFSSDNISHRGDDAFFSCILANSGTWNSAHASSVQSQSATSIAFTTAPIAGATSATLTAAWGSATTTYSVVFFETLGAATEVRTVTLTNGATTATWAGGLTLACTTRAMALTYLAIFNNRIENCRLHMGGIASITRAVYAPSWQQKCGCDNVYLQNYVQYGVYMDNGYGGAAQVRMRKLEVFADPSCLAGSYGVYANFTGYTTGWISVDLEEVQCAAFLATVTFTGALVAATSATLTAIWPYPSGAWNVQFSDGSYRLVTLTNGATTATWAGAVTATANASGISPNSNGVSGNGRVILNCDDVHFEQLQSGFVLQNGTVLAGTSVKADGNNTVQAVIQCSGSWTGTINVDAVERGGATNFIQDNSRGPYAWANAPGVAGFPGGAGGGSFSQRTIWPPDPSIPLFGARVVGGAAPTISYQNGTILSVTHPAGGTYRFTMSVSMDGASLYDVQCSSDLTTSWTPNSATQFDVFTRNPAGALTDCNQLSVKVFHSP